MPPYRIVSRSNWLTENEDLAGSRGVGVVVDLLLQQAAMTGHAQPFTILKYPGIGETTEMLIRLAAIGAFRMIITRYDRRGGVHFHLYVIDIHSARLELGVREIRQKLPSIADLSVVFGIDKFVADHACDCGRIAHDLGLVPHALERNQFSRLPVRNWLESLGESAWKQKTADNRRYDSSLAPYRSPYEHDSET
jgi:hypothetical protein